MASRGFFRNALILGLISAVGPFAIDMYLPALPSIGASLGASPHAVQMTLMAFFITIGVGQLVYGPAADIFGRKAPLYFGLSIFTIGSIGCALAPTIEMLIACRVLQGVGACAGMVIPRAIVRDLHTGPEATKLMSLLMLVFSVAPILAPLSGSFIILWASWRGIFVFVALFAVLALILVATQLCETRPAEARTESSWRSAVSGYGLLLKDRRFLGLVLTGGFGISTFFAYLANSSFVLIGHYGLSPTRYSLFFAANAISFIGVAQLNGLLTARFGLPTVVRWASVGFAASMATLLAITLSGVDSLPVLAGLLFIGYGFLGLVIPTSAVLALDAHGKIAGTASALMGAMQMITGAVVMGLVGIFADGTPLPMVTGIAASSAMSFLLCQITLWRRKPAAL